MRTELRWYKGKGDDSFRLQAREASGVIGPGKVIYGEKWMDVPKVEEAGDYWRDAIKVPVPRRKRLEYDPYGKDR